MKKSDDDKGKSKTNASGSGLNDVKENASEKQISGNPTETGGSGMGNDEGSESRKRMRECNLGMLNWVRNVAKDPCNSVIGSLPESNRWKNYGTELQWKQVLSSRQAMLMQTNARASSVQSVWQRMRKMHPAMYDGQIVLRSSSRIATAKDSSDKSKEKLASSSQANDSHLDSTPEKYIPIGPRYQAELPDLVGNEYESDLKWLGTQFWPSSRNEQRNVHEQDPIGKGGQESCGCQLRGSLECVGFHIRKNRSKVKMELGSAFYTWRFDKMGEEVALTWTKTDEIKFADTVKSNPLSAEKDFWEELSKVFPSKGREALVNYYFNVFLLQRRCKQNRDTTAKFDSDDDESEYGPVANRFGHRAASSPGSIFRSPKKTS